MARLDDRLVIQLVDGDQVVFMDESSGNEVVVPVDQIQNVIDLLAYFQRAVRPVQS